MASGIEILDELIEVAEDVASLIDWHESGNDAAVTLLEACTKARKEMAALERQQEKLKRDNAQPLAERPNRSIFK